MSQQISINYMYKEKTSWSSCAEPLAVNNWWRILVQLLIFWILLKMFIGVDMSHNNFTFTLELHYIQMSTNMLVATQHVHNSRISHSQKAFQFILISCTGKQRMLCDSKRGSYTIQLKKWKSMELKINLYSVALTGEVTLWSHHTVN